MRRRRQGWPGHGALIALLLHLALPFVTMHNANASSASGAPFAICTGTGLVWISPEVRPAAGPQPDSDRPIDHYCPICATKQLGSAVLLAMVALILPAAPYAAIALRPIVPRPPLVSSAPPLPARGPPLAD